MRPIPGAALIVFECSAAGSAGAGVIQGLSDRYQAATHDIHGHGRSVRPHAAEAHGIPMGQDVMPPPDRLRIEQAHVVVRSTGGGAPTRTLGEQPERVPTTVTGGAGWMHGQRLKVGRVGVEQTAQSLAEGNRAGPLIAARMAG